MAYIDRITKILSGEAHKTPALEDIFRSLSQVNIFDKRAPSYADAYAQILKGKKEDAKALYTAQRQAEADARADRQLEQADDRIKETQKDRASREKLAGIKSDADKTKATADAAAKQEKARLTAEYRKQMLGHQEARTQLQREKNRATAGATEKTNRDKLSKDFEKWIDDNIPPGVGKDGKNHREAAGEMLSDMREGYRDIEETDIPYDEGILQLRKWMSDNQIKGTIDENIKGPVITLKHDDGTFMSIKQNDPKVPKFLEDGWVKVTTETNLSPGLRTKQTTKAREKTKRVAAAKEGMLRTRVSLGSLRELRFQAAKFGDDAFGYRSLILDTFSGPLEQIVGKGAAEMLAQFLSSGKSLDSKEAAGTIAGIRVMAKTIAAQSVPVVTGEASARISDMELRIASAVTKLTRPGASSTEIKAALNQLMIEQLLARDMHRIQAGQKVRKEHNLSTKKGRSAFMAWADRYYGFSDGPDDKRGEAYLVQLTRRLMDLRKEEQIYRD